MNITEELNFLDKRINYIADYEAGTPFLDITTILDISHKQYSGIVGVLYILALALEGRNLMIIQETVQYFSLLLVVGSFLSHVFI